MQREPGLRHHMLQVVHGPSLLSRMPQALPMVSDGCFYGDGLIYYQNHQRQVFHMPMCTLGVCVGKPHGGGFLTGRVGVGFSNGEVSEASQG